MYTLSNMSPGPPVGALLSVRAPLEPIKGKACSLEQKFKRIQRLPSSQALGMVKFSQAIQHTVDVGFYAPMA
jgi:hypothetical protein